MKNLPFDSLVWGSLRLAPINYHIMYILVLIIAYCKLGKVYD